METRDSYMMNRRELLKMGTGIVLASAAALRTSAPRIASAQITNITCQGQGLHRGVSDEPVHPQSVLRSVADSDAAEALLARGDDIRLPRAGTWHRSAGLARRHTSVLA